MLVIDFKILYRTILETINNLVPVSFYVVRCSPIRNLPAKDFIHGSVTAQMGVIHVGINYPAMFIHHHIPGVGGFNDCPVSFFTFAQSFFRLLAFCDVFDKQDASYRPILIANGPPINSDESALSVNRGEWSFQKDVLPFLQNIQVGYQPGLLYPGDLPDIHPLCTRPGISDRKPNDLFQLRILKLYPHFLIHPDNADGCVSEYFAVELQQGPVLFLRILQSLLCLPALL